MSLGYQGYARKYSEDETHIIYEYSVENWNKPYSHKGQLFDGLIVIDKSTFVEPEIHEKLKRMPSGRRKLITKKIIVIVDVCSLVEDRRVEIKNSCRSWRIVGNTDYYAISLCHIIYDKYQELGCAPDKVGFLV